MSTGNETPITCSSSSPCNHRCLGPGSNGYICGYNGYCDYQLPRDSRPMRLCPSIGDWGNAAPQCTCGTTIPCQVHGGNAIHGGHTI